jgi:hypothetical protein
MLLLLLLIPVVALSTFENELRRLIILSVCYSFTYYSELHIVIRYTVSKLVIFGTRKRLTALFLGYCVLGFRDLGNGDVLLPRVLDIARLLSNW